MVTNVKFNAELNHNWCCKKRKWQKTNIIYSNIFTIQFDRIVWNEVGAWAAISCWVGFVAEEIV